MKIADVTDAMISATPCAQMLPATQPRNVVSAPANTMNSTSNPTPLSTRIAARTLHRWLASAVAICLVAGTFSAWGTTVTWNGSQDPDKAWSNAANWSPSGAPADGVDLVFPTTTKLASINDIPSSTLSYVNSVTISGAGYNISSSTGDTLGVAGGVTLSAGSGVVNWTIPTSLTAAGQTFTVDNVGAILNFDNANALDLGANTLTVAGAGDTTFAGIVAGAGGGFIKNGTGKLALSGLQNNTYTGKTIVNNGIVFIIGEASLGGDPGSFTADQLTLDGGTLQAGLSDTIGNANVNLGITLGAGGGTFLIDATKTLIIANEITGPGTLTKTGPGTLTLSAANTLLGNTYEGKTTVSAGTLSIDTEDRLGLNPTSGFIADHLTINGGTLNAFDTFTIDDVNRGVTLGASGGTISVLGATKTLTVANVITGSGLLTKTLTGFLTLSAANDYAGGTTLSAGKLNINHASALGSGAFSIAASTVIDNTSAGAVALSTYNNAQNWNGDFTFTGTQDLDLGTGNVTLSAARTVTASAKTLTVGGVVSGAFGLTKSGVGTMFLSGTASTYTGQTKISAGILKVNSINSVSAVSGSSIGQPINVGNGTIDIGATAVAGTLIYAGSGDTSDRVINLAGTTGGATIQSDGAGALSFTTTPHTATGSGAKTLTLKGSNTGENTISGVIPNGASSTVTTVTKAGTGKWVLSGTSTFTGNVTVQEGTLSVPSVNNASANGPLGNNATAVTLGSSSKTGTLQYTGGGTPTSTKKFTMAASGTGVFQIDGGNLTLTGLLDGSGALTKTGSSGTLTFATTTETYSGVTTVSQGKLVVNSGTASGSAVTVASGATLGGTGTAAGTVVANGILSPGNSPGTLNSGAETWNSGGSYDWDISNVSGAAGTQWDLLNITGTLTVAATSGSKFTIRVVSPVGGPTGFDNTQNYSWLIATASSGLGGTFAANKFTIDTSGFDALQGPGAFVISQSGNNVYLQFGHVTASAVTVGRAWGTYLRILKSDFLTANTSGGTGTRTVQSVTSRNSDFVDYSGDYILFAPAGNATRILDYTVVDSSSPTPYSASSTITVTVTNAVRTCDQINYSAGSVTLKFAGMPGFSYVVERSAAVEGTWAEVAGSATNLPSNIGVWTFTDSSPLSPNCYYRLRQKNTLE